MKTLKRAFLNDTGTRKHVFFIAKHFYDFSNASFSLFISMFNCHSYDFYAPV